MRCISKGRVLFSIIVVNITVNVFDLDGRSHVIQVHEGTNRELLPDETGRPSCMCASQGSL